MSPLRSESATVTNLEVCGRRILDCLGRDTSLARRPRQWFRRGLGQRAVSYPAGWGLPGIKATKCRLATQPGRVIVRNTGILVSRVVYTKQSGEKRFLIQDAAMKDLIRPALYESFHRLWPVLAPAGYHQRWLSRDYHGANRAMGCVNPYPSMETFWPRITICLDLTVVISSASPPPAPTGWSRHPMTRHLPPRLRSSLMVLTPRLGHRCETTKKLIWQDIEVVTTGRVGRANPKCLFVNCPDITSPGSRRHIQPKMP